MARTVPLKLMGEPQSDERVESAPPLLAMGFRPFFLVAAAFAVVATAMWLHALTAGSNPSGGYLAPSLWHAHEMLFGFTTAVIAGFLLTAARNWTGLDTLHGRSLGALVLLWLLGRVTMLGIGLPPVITAVVGVAFPAALAVVVGRVIVRAGSRRNLGVVAILTLLTLAASAVHLDTLGALPGAARPALVGALHLIVTLTVVIAGRIIPLFTRNRTEVATRSIPSVDRAAIGAAACVALLAVTSTAWPNQAILTLLGIVAALSALLQLFRMRTWGVGPALRIPMLAVLHAGYMWVAIGHALIAVSVVWQGMPITLALHALTIGAIGTMTIGMMARVSMGHTGREIRASKLLVLAFVAVNAAAVIRLCAAVVPASWLELTWVASGSLFAVGFAAYLGTSARWLVTARPDGRPG